MGFEKLDGSNIRIKYTPKKEFCLFGSRHTLFDEKHPHLGEVVGIFREDLAEELLKVFRKEFRNEKEIICFGEFLGENSFAGLHKKEDKKEFYLFDILLKKKNWYEFVTPKEFIKTFGQVVKIPKVVYEGNFNDELIKNVREGKYNVKEGVVAKGTNKRGDYRGKVWMAKIKTTSYLTELKRIFGQEWEKYAE